MLEVKGDKKGVFRDIFFIEKVRFWNNRFDWVGRTEVTRAFVPLIRKMVRYIWKKKVVFGIWRAIKKCFCYLTEDRKHQGIF